MKCKQKRRYSKEDIELAAKFKSAERGQKMYYYHCHCGWYHLTSKSRSEFRKIKNLAILGIPLTFGSKDYEEIENIFKNYCK